MLQSRPEVEPVASCCVHHPDRPAHALCMSCAAAVCQECATTWDGINYCAPCLARRGRALEDRRTWPALVLLVAACAGLLWLGASLMVWAGALAASVPVKPVELSAGDVLDDAADLVSSLAPWVGFVWLTSLPLRLAQAHFAARLLELRADAPTYGDHLRGLAFACALALLLSTWGRVVFANACRRRLQGVADDDAGAFRLAPAGLVCCLYAVLAIEVVFYATCLSAFAVPLLALVSGLAAVTVPFESRPGLLQPFATVSASLGRPGPLTLLVLAFVSAFVLSFANLLALAYAGLWLAQGLAGLDVGRWSGLLSVGYPRFLCVAAACAWLLIEPWWIAALAVHVHKRRARSTGEDLRLWFERLRRAAA